MILKLPTEHSSARKHQQAVHSHFATAVRTVNENCCMNNFHECLWLVVSGVWSYVCVYVVLFLYVLKCTCVYVYVYECLNISVFVVVYVYVCVRVYLFACAYRRVTVTQSSAARPPASSGSRSSVLSSRRLLGNSVRAQHGTRGLCCLPDWHLRHGHAQRRLRLAPCCGWCMFCFCGVLLCWCACRRCW